MAAYDYAREDFIDDWDYDDTPIDWGEVDSLDEQDAREEAEHGRE